MKKFVFSTLIFLILSVCFSSKLNAQVTMGSLEEPNKGALLDLTQGLNKTEGATSTTRVTSTKGLLLPRVELSDLKKLKMGGFEITDSDEKLKHTGLTVYHIPPATTGQGQDIPAGVYYWDGAKWGRYGGEAEKPVIELSVDPALITYEDYEKDVRYYTVNVTRGARWTIVLDQSSSNPHWNVVASEQNGTIAIFPKNINVHASSEEELNITVYASMLGAETVSTKVSAIQKTAPFLFGITPSSQTYKGNEKETFPFVIGTDEGVQWTFETPPHWEISKTSGSGEYRISITPKEFNESGADIVTTLKLTGKMGDVVRERTITLTHKAKEAP